ncbi:hypothetical protein [Pseudomonas sp. TH10]|uniref:hypothetical protein n=1 Tax=Pseudomonas sp. TH10 TaxID=2796376 RepID=UPI001913903F|nr:hypothetical protein [Pseudomonas sp. TH10]MBK5516423.1 hypothetical protein [Pseudomonas sp. TH10]
MISLELSSIQQKDVDRAWLARAIAGYVAQGKVIDVVETSRSLFNSTPFNTGIIPPSSGSEPSPAKRNLSVKIQKSAKSKAFEADIAEKMKAYFDKGMVAAAKDLHISTRRASHIAAMYGIKFASRVSAAAKLEDLAFVPKIRDLILEGLTQDQMCAKLGIGRTTLKRIAGQNGLRFRSKENHARDLVLVDRIKAIRDVGCTRAACARKLEINPKVLLRLIAEHEIDFPVRGDLLEAA